MRTVNGVLVLSAVGLLAACDAGAPQGPTCVEAVWQLAAMTTPPGDPLPKQQVITNQIIGRCEEDQWSAAARQCMSKARSATGILECRHKHLTGAQDEVLAKLLDSMQETPVEAAAMAMVMMENFSAGMCACHDATCAQQISNDMNTWSAKQQARTGGPPMLSAEQDQRFMELTRKFQECTYRANHNGEPPPLCDEVSCVLNNYEGDCCAKFVQGSHRPVTSLTRADISKGVTAVKAAIMQCGDKSTARGKVKVKVRVGPDGKVASVVVDTTPDAELGTCVAAAMKKASFVATDAGGSFSYPFIF